MWFKAEKEGIFYGECNELCGVNHSFMPIQVDVVSQAKYDAWVAAHAPKTPAARRLAGPGRRARTVRPSGALHTGA